MHRWLVLVALGCGSSSVRMGDESAPAPAVASADCDAAGGEGAPGWTRVRAEGFSFCVPSSMKRDGATVWRGAGTIEWGVGAPPALLLDAQRRRDPMEGRRFPDFSPRDIVDGRVAHFWYVYASGRYLSGVRFDEPRVFVSGEAGNERDRATHRAVYQSIRFR